ncbi:MAG TPA: isoprenylcysteine carboxylmethyltransferase family protein [Myxococcota bacterium]|nr:isoprenylcysteine carboxylmethyltransferase family protein [Myxococcota bacterium]HND33974.1 isoprenylcysteine carboxylmethyltransferase family protein [Myxococcota bacterium]
MILIIIIKMDPMPQLPYQISFLALCLALFAIRMYWHLRAKVLEKGIDEPSEGRSVPIIRWLVLPVWSGLILMWLFAPSILPWLQLPLPPVLRWGGAALAAAGLLLLHHVHVALDRQFSPKLRIVTDHRLIQHGPYRYIRHPMYTSFLLLIFGLFLLSAHLLLGLTGLGMIATVLWTRTPREEAMLLRHFGKDYADYQQRTGRLLPRWW